jgi:hypothetical protein
MKIAPEHPKRQRIASGVHVKKRLLLDRIALNARNVPVRHAELACLVESDLADPPAPRRNQASVPAGHTSNAVPFLTPQRARPGILVKGVGQAGAGKRGCFSHANGHNLR